MVAPPAAVNNKNIDNVRRTIETDRHMTYPENWASPGMVMCQMRSILYKNLDMNTLCSWWIPQKFDRGSKNEPLNDDWCTTICLPKVIDELRKNNRKRRIILHHDKASSHTAKQTNKCVKEKNVELMSNPAYSFDLALSDFFMFTKIKKQLRGQRFSSSEKAVKEYEKHTFEITRSRSCCTLGLDLGPFPSPTPPDREYLFSFSVSLTT
ncbi:Mariner Mos1 transposase [Eumeta japonica]|uniref:Mariner Mos1 transposase n=1 Tax=Eumeta variegata TaxID=151549 RepID=A0A4C1YJ42_EUMVA|nr:Mariner Mos1 transposase [Eumeta japonica]